MHAMKATADPHLRGASYVTHQPTSKQNLDNHSEHTTQEISSCVKLSDLSSDVWLTRKTAVTTALPCSYIAHVQITLFPLWLYSKVLFDSRSMLPGANLKTPPSPCGSSSIQIPDELLVTVQRWNSTSDGAFPLPTATTAPFRAMWL